MKVPGILGAVLLLSLVGCSKDIKNARQQQTLNAAHKALQQGDLELMKTVLTGRALRLFGTPEGFKLLQGQLTSWNSPAVSSLTLVSAVRSGVKPGDLLGVYRAEITETANGKPVPGALFLQCPPPKVDEICKISKTQLASLDDQLE